MCKKSILAVLIIVIGLCPAGSTYAVGLGEEATYSLDTSTIIRETSGFTSLDGTWSHDNGGDAWDGSAIGDGSPGGVSVIDGYLRIQDPGDPRDNGFPDPGYIQPGNIEPFINRFFIGAVRQLIIYSGAIGRKCASRCMNGGISLEDRQRFAGTEIIQKQLTVGTTVGVTSVVVCLIIPVIRICIQNPFSIR